MRKFILFLAIIASSSIFISCGKKSEEIIYSEDVTINKEKEVNLKKIEVEGLSESENIFYYPIGYYNEQLYFIRNYDRNFENEDSYKKLYKLNSKNKIQEVKDMNLKDLVKKEFEKEVFIKENDIYYVDAQRGISKKVSEFKKINEKNRTYFYDAGIVNGSEEFIYTNLSLKTKEKYETEEIKIIDIKDKKEYKLNVKDCENIIEANYLGGKFYLLNSECVVYTCRLVNDELIIENESKLLAGRKIFSTFYNEDSIIANVMVEDEKNSKKIEIIKFNLKDNTFKKIDFGKALNLIGGAYHKETKRCILTSVNEKESKIFLANINENQVNILKEIPLEGYSGECEKIMFNDNGDEVYIQYVSYNDGKVTRKGERVEIS